MGRNPTSPLPHRTRFTPFPGAKWQIRDWFRLNFLRMKTILCFGDSNTWGFDPASITAPFPSRHPHDVRWTGVLAATLGAGYRVIEEGQNGRTTVHEDPHVIGRKGREYLTPCLESHKPIDLVILMLGTNDLKSTFNVPPGEIANGANALAKMILTSETGPANKPPPPPVGLPT